MEQPDKIPFVFLTSHAYSGSTLTSFLLGAHPDIATVGMLTGPAWHLSMDEYRCSCGELFKEDPFWQEVTAVLNRLGLSYSPDQHMATRIELGQSDWMQRLRTKSLRHNLLENIRDWTLFNFWPGHRQELMDLVRRNELFARAIIEVMDRPIFLDTSKDPMRIRYLRMSPHIDMYVIHLVRDVRGVVMSIMNRRPETTVEEATRHWLVAEHNIKRHLEAVPANRQIKVRYEDIARDTLPTLNRLYEFIGLDALPALPDFREVENHILGNKMRKRGASEIKLDERWRTFFSDSQLQLIDRLVAARA
jgi:hypothetical protein